MKRLVRFLLVLALLAAAAGAAYFALREDCAVAVDDRILSRQELDWRARTMMEDAFAAQHIAVAPGGEKEALRHYAREAAKAWVVKEVLLAEAKRRGMGLDAAARRRALAQAEAKLKQHRPGTTMEDFFARGPMPRALKEREFEEGAVVANFVAAEVDARIRISPAEITRRQSELEHLALTSTAPGAKPKIAADRTAALESLRRERSFTGFRDLFRRLYARHKVRSPVFPELATLEGVSPARPAKVRP